MLGRVIVELSELTGFARAELESLKSFISSETMELPGWPTVVILRRPYGGAFWWGHQMTRNVCRMIQAATRALFPSNVARVRTSNHT